MIDEKVWVYKRPVSRCRNNQFQWFTAEKTFQPKPGIWTRSTFTYERWTEKEFCVVVKSCTNICADFQSCFTDARGCSHEFSVSNSFFWSSQHHSNALSGPLLCFPVRNNDLASQGMIKSRKEALNNVLRSSRHGAPILKNSHCEY